MKISRCSIQTMLFFGSATSHMVTQDRSKSIDGPWENAPNNPLIHTYSNDEKWWSKGHGSLIDTPDGQNWHKEQWTADITDLNHNKLGEFQSIMAGIFAFGDGKATVSNFKFSK